MATKSLNLKDILPGENPRTHFPEDEHDALVDSIRLNGLIQRIVVIVSEQDESKYTIVAGERRWRALNTLAKKDKSFATTDCVILHPESKAKVAFMRLAENNVRLNLSLMEQARHFRVLCDTFSADMKQGEVAKMAGIRDSDASKLLCLLELPEKTQGYIHEGKLDKSKAFEFYRLRKTLTDKKIDKLVEMVISKDLNYVEVHTLVEKLLGNAPEKQSKPPLAGGYARVQSEITRWLGKSAKVSVGKDGAGKFTVNFKSEEEMHNILSVLKQGYKPSLNNFDEVLADAKEFTPDADEIAALEGEFESLDDEDGGSEELLEEMDVTGIPKHEDDSE